MTGKKGIFFYGWWIVGNGFILQLLASALFFNSTGAYASALHEAYGWSNTSLNLGFSLNRVESGILGPVQGWAIDKFGPSIMIRIGAVLLGGGLILFSSCQSDPIVHNPTGSYEYQKKSFQLNSETSETIQGDLHTGMSPRLYSGILSNGDTIFSVSTLIRLLPEVLDSHQVCGVDSISKVNISLSSMTQLAEGDTNFLIQKGSVKIYLISLNEIWDEDAVFDSTRLSIITNAIDNTPTLSDSLIEIKNKSENLLALFTLLNILSPKKQLFKCTPYNPPIK